LIDPVPQREMAKTKQINMSNGHLDILGMIYGFQ